MKTHKSAVAKLVEDVARFYNSRAPFWIHHGSTNCTRQFSFDRSGIIDTSNLNHVLDINSKSMIAIAEPNVSMDLLLLATLKHGLIPHVVPEFPGITVGGAFSGTAGESSSFKYGYFDRTVNSTEIILANGEVTRASRTGHKKDLFNGAAGVFGTLGVLTVLEIQLIPAKKYMALTYIHVGDTKDAIETLKECVVAEKQPFDFVDSNQFSKDSGRRPRKRDGEIYFIDRGMDKSLSFRKFSSEIYSVICHSLLFQLARDIYKTYLLAQEPLLK